jgi:hypothetical protein
MDFKDYNMEVIIKLNKDDIQELIQKNELTLNVKLVYDTSAITVDDIKRAKKNLQKGK